MLSIPLEQWKNLHWKNYLITFLQKPMFISFFFLWKWAEITHCIRDNVQNKNKITSWWLQQKTYRLSCSLKKIKNKKCANFSSWRLWISILSIIVCMFFVKLPPRTAAALSMEKKQNFYGRTRGQKQNKPRSPCVSLIIAVISWNAETIITYSPKKKKRSKKLTLHKNKSECCL